MSAPLTKAVIIGSVHDQLGFNKNESAEIVEILFKIIKDSLEMGEDVLVSGFGKFCVQNKRQRRGRNPYTGGDLMLKPRRVVAFKCSGMLRERINGNG
jgi:integration host factor subunit alpha